MKKTLFTAVLAFVLSIGGVALFAEDEANAPASTVSSNLLTVVVSSKTNAKALTQGLSQLAANTQVEVTQDNFGYKLDNGDFCSLATAIENAKNIKATSDTNLLGTFSENPPDYNFGFVENNTFNAVGPTLNVASDPLFYGEFNSDGFYQLDFTEYPFDGMIEIYVGEPLPASTVTMLIALATAGAFLLYRNRKTRARVVSVQA